MGEVSNLEKYFLKITIHFSMAGTIIELLVLPKAFLPDRGLYGTISCGFCSSLLKLCKFLINLSV